MANAPNMYLETKNVGGRAEVDKVEACKWTMVDRPGVFQSIRKRDLFVDPEYQRTKISNPRVLLIASAWSWMACGCLLVARRLDGSYWVFDGQHRKLAADKRSDVQELPCLVFNVDEKAEEALGFVRSNTVRGAMPAYNKFRALVSAKDKTALEINEMVESHGYTISPNNDEKCVCCVAALTREYLFSSSVARRIFGLLVRLSKGKGISAEVFLALCLLEHFLQRQAFPSLLDNTYENRLDELGVDGLLSAIRRASQYHQKGGAKVGAEGIKDALNRGRRSHRIPSLFNVEQTSED